MKKTIAILVSTLMAAGMTVNAFAAEATLGIDGEPTKVGSLIPAWAEKGVPADLYIGIDVEGSEVSGALADEAQVADGVVTVDGVNVTSELGDALNDLGATNTTYMYVNGGAADTSAVVKNSSFVFSDNSDGKNANDFTGAGAVFVVTGAENTKTDLTLDGVEIVTDGFGRDAVIVDAYANAFVVNSSILTKGSDPLTEAYEGYASSAAQAYMISPPWILGIYGGVRAANTLGKNSTYNLIDSVMETGGWAVISTDDCTTPTVNVLNSVMAVTEYDPESPSTTMNGGAALFGYEKNYGSAYGTYNIGSSYENFYGAIIDGTTYATILTGAGPTYFGASYDGIELVNGATGEVIYTYAGEGQDTVVTSVFGVMDHQGAASTVLDAGSIWNTEEAVILVRGAQKSTYTVSGAEMNPKSGIIFQMMDDDDGYGTSGGGGDTAGEQGFAKWTGEAWGMPTFSSGFADPNEAGFVAPATGGAYNTTLELTTNAAGDAVTYTGDIYNGTGTGAGATAGGLIVDIAAGVTLDGAISSASSVHGLPYSAEAVEYLDALAATYGEEGISPNGGEYYTVKYTLMDADGNIVEDAANAAYIQITEFTANEYYIISHVINKVMEGPNMLVQVAEGAAWTVTSDSYISGIINNGTVTVAEGATLYISGEAYTGEIPTGEIGLVTSAEGGSVDTSTWVVGENYRTAATGKYHDITIDDGLFYYIGGAEPATGDAILDVAFGLMGWLEVGDDGSYTVSETYVEAPASSGGESGGAESAGEPSGEGESADAPAAQPSEEEILAAYKAYMTEWLQNENAINDSMTDEQVPEFQACIDANDYSEFPGDMFFSGMLESGAAMTYDEFAASYVPEAPAAPAAADTSKEAYTAYLKEYASAIPAIQANIDEFYAAIDGGDYTVFPADMLFTDSWFGYAAMTYDDFVAANGAYEIPAFDPSITPDAAE